MLMPLPLETTELSPTCEPELVRPMRKPTLLIVDDEEGVRQSLRVVFKDEYQLLLAGDGATAIQLAQQNKIDVAVLDIRMAGMSGIELLERLKFVDHTIEVVMMTAYETTETMRQALRLRACDYINKPFDIPTMCAAVSTAAWRTAASSVMSTVRPIVLTWKRSAISAAAVAAAWRSQMATFAPSPANDSAMARPMPLAPPVMTAT